LTIFLAHLLLIPSTSAAPSRLHRRGLPGAVYICTGPNFTGDCGWLMPNSGSCHIAGTGENTPQSVGPDPGGSCVLFEKADCTGNQELTLRFPGQGGDLPTFGGVKCFADGQPRDDGAGIAAEVDVRLAGGIGSVDRKEVQQQVEAMEADGFSQGMIGLKKGVYY
ncbi:hypothetical protein BS50DRAFT_447472, partial [Corynespora cassiicola Philippines]